MDMNQLTKIALSWELYQAGTPKTHIANQLRVHRETVHLWIVGIQAWGPMEFLDRYQRAKKGQRTKRKVDGLLKVRIWGLRETNRHCCGQKIRQYLHDQYGISLGVKAIYKILAEKYQLRSRWKKNQVRSPIPKATQPRQVVQMDTIDFGAIFAFTGIDIFAKDVTVKLYPALTSLEGKDFLDHSFETRFKHTDLLQTDGGPEFKDHFRKQAWRYTDRFRVARPYRKNEQAYIESFNRSLRKECLGWSKYSPQHISSLQQEVNNYLTYYHTQRAHLALNLKTPAVILKEYGVSDI